MSPTPELNTGTVALSPSHHNASTSMVRPALASLAILLPSGLAAITSLPLPVRGVSAILGGLAVLLCGSYLLGKAFSDPAPRAATPS